MVKILSPLLIFFLHCHFIRLYRLWSHPSHKHYFFYNTSQFSSNNFKIINASIDYISSKKRFEEPLFKMNSLINKVEFSHEFTFLYIIIIILFILFTYLSISVLSYSEVLSSILVFSDRVILFACFFFIFYGKWSVNICSYIYIYKNNKKLG